MKLSKGAVAALTRGAQTGDETVNAVMDDGTQQPAGQRLCSKDPELKEVRKTIKRNECHPVLEITRTEWCGNWSLRKYPVIKCTCTDAGKSEEITIMASWKDKAVHAKRIYSKSGPHHKGGLNVGRKIQLIEYTTEMSGVDKRFHHKDEPLVLMERIRCEPVQSKAKQTKMKDFLWANRNNNNFV